MHITHGSKAIPARLLSLLEPYLGATSMVLAGGAVLADLMNVAQAEVMEVKDYDFFVLDPNVVYGVYSKLRPYEVSSSEYNVTYDVDGLKVQVMAGHIGHSISHMFADFDLTVCEVATDGRHVFWSDAALEDIINWKVRVSNTSKPYSTLMRLIKYNHKRGFQCDMQEYKLLCECMSKETLQSDPYYNGHLGSF